jgi:uncharacterized protein
MLRLAGEIAYSATDLNNYLACEHLTALEREVALGRLERPKVDRPQADVLRDLGEAHERRYLERLIEDGLEVVTIPRPERGSPPDAAVDATIAAMGAGAAVIYQAAFLHDRWLGYADFLLRVDGPSELGDYHYEVGDTKLARTSEPYFILQLCNYSEHVARVQGVAPRRMHVILGDGRTESFEVAEFAAHYRAVKARFLSSMERAAETAPYPVLHCDLCSFQALCDAQLDAADSLSRVARIMRLHVDRLTAAGTATLEALSYAQPEDRPADIRPPIFETLRRQARLQREHRDALAAGVARPNTVELLEIDPDLPQPRAFGLLPARDEGDLFFDMEGDPYYSEGDRWFGGESGLEYLFGVYTLDGAFTPFWGCDRDGPQAPRHRLHEKQAFEAFVDFVMARRAAYPSFHIYHYAPYEVTAMKRLSERHHTREDEIADLLREDRFVDLYKVVRQGMAVGQPHYGIKYLENYYEDERRTGVKKGDDSIVEFERWLASRAAGTPDRGILDDIEQYNRFDCVSTEHLLTWLWSLREDAPAVEVRAIEPPKPVSPRRQALLDDIAAISERLNALLPGDLVVDDIAKLPERMRAAWLLSELLQYHERERRPAWWEYFDLLAAYADDPGVAVENASAIGDLTVLGVNAEGTVLAFPPQNHKIDAGYVKDLATGEPAGKVVRIDDERGHLVWKASKGGRLDPPRAIVQFTEIGTEALVRSLLGIAERLLASHGAAVPDEAVFDLLLARAPRLHGAGRGGIVQPNVTDAAGVAAVVDALASTCLPIQGPPGTGKTTKAAAVIAGLIERGMRVGIAAPSHAVAHNLLDRIGAHAAAAGVAYTVAHKGADENAYVPNARALAGFVSVADDVDPNDVPQIVSGTAWLFSKPELTGTLDYLFVDEAGQLPLANALAMAPAAKNVVLIGDPQQLAQVSKASHQGPAGASALAHLLGDDATVPPDRGVFLDRTYRMHGDVCAFVSQISYAGRLHQAPACDRQRVDSPGFSGTGLRTIAIAHEGNRSASQEEADRIADEIERLLQGTVVDRDGARRALRPSDIIVVTPYNAQRRVVERTVRARVGDGIEVGTVNKFQGREAYVVFYTMASSGGESIPRGTQFLFERNRLNVAVSRAHALAVLVFSPALLEARTSSIDAMRLINGLDLFVEIAASR